METTNNALNCISMQDFGRVIVMDAQLTVVGLSIRALYPAEANETSYIGKRIETFFHDAFKKVQGKLLKLVKNVATKDLPKQMMAIRVHGKNHYFKCFKNGCLVYLEWEPQLKKYVSASKLNELGFLLDPTYSNKWSMVCSAANKFLNLERVFVLQVYESGQSKVIAEDHPSDDIFGLNKEFSPSFMSQETIDFYQHATYRYAANLSKKHDFIYDRGANFTPIPSQLALLPDIQRAYFSSLGITSIILFPIIIHGEFWGLLVGYHKDEKKVDVQERKLCSFFVQNSAGKYENTLKQNLLKRNEQIKNMENLLKERLYQNNSIYSAMIQSMDILMAMTHSDGVAIFNEGEVSSHGKTTDSKTLYAIIEYVAPLTKNFFFKDHNFRLNHGKEFSSPLPFAGLLTYRLDYNSDFYILWFRKEEKVKITQIELQNENQKRSTRDATLPTIKVREKSIRDSAIPWDETEISFTDYLRQIMNAYIIRKAKEKDSRAEELEILNNELEMFSYTLSHDLKNPLSVLTTGLQFLALHAKNLPEQKLRGWYENLISSTNNITDIVNNMVSLSQNKTKTFVKDLVPMHYSIKKIAQEAVFLHDTSSTKITYGNLLPIWGEKSALYQIFMNVIGNAVKYSSSRENPEVSIASFAFEDQIHYRIKDNGIGIPESNIGSIYDMFIRADNALAHEGSGVGLALVKRIVDRMGGSINITSVENKSTQIDLHFPLIDRLPIHMIENP